MTGNTTEHVIVYGAKGVKTDANHLGTLQWILASLNHDRVARVTILDFVARQIKRYTSNGKDVLPMSNPDLDGMAWLFTYLMAGEVTDKPALPVGGLDVLTHADYNGVYVQNGYQLALSKDLPPTSLLLEATKRRLAKNCRIKLWGCNNFQMIQLTEDPTFFDQLSAKSGHQFELSRKLIKGFEGLKDALLAKYRPDKGYEKRGLVFSGVTALTNAGRKKALKRLAQNIVNACFLERQYHALFTEVTAYAVALSETLERPVIASPWGVGADGDPSKKPEFAKAKKNLERLKTARPALYGDWFKNAPAKFKATTQMLVPGSGASYDPFWRWFKQEMKGILIPESSSDGSQFRLSLPRHRGASTLSRKFYVYDWKVIQKQKQGVP